MSGTEIPNHRAKMATRVPKGIAADEPSTHSIRFIRKKSAKTILWYKTGRDNTHQTVNVKSKTVRTFNCSYTTHRHTSRSPREKTTTPK